MPPALKAALARARTLLLAAAAGGAAQLGGQAQAVIEPEMPTAQAAERRTWEEVSEARTPEAYQRYLELFPTGEHAEEAFRLLILRSFERQPVRRLVDVEPVPGASGLTRERVVAAAELSLY